MLLELRVLNLGVIREAAVGFGPGLNVVTGETGAGKTLLVTSLALLAGARSEPRLVLSGANEAMIEGVFSVPDHLQQVLCEQGFDVGEEVIVARRIGSDGRSRAWVDGRTVTIASAAEIVGHLLEMHGQGAGFALARPQVQLEALDALAGSATVVGAYRTALGCLRDLEAEHHRLRGDAESRQRERAFLATEAEEIERAALVGGEDEQIDSEVARLENVERLSAAAMEATALISSEGASGLLARAHKLVAEAAQIDHTLRGLGSRLEGLATEAADAAWELREWADRLEPDPARLEALRERSALISSLKRRYGASVQEIVRTATAARDRLEELEGDDTRSEHMEGALQALRSELEELADDLSSRRRRAAASLTELVNSELGALALPNAAFEARCLPSEGFTEQGRDRVEFLFSSHRSRKPDLIGKVASGGELSRAMIAITLALARAHSVPVLVFDEADQGLGGAAALELARRLRKLGCSHQVLVVSHLPQIAAFAERHVAVRKEGKEVELQELGAEGRIEEISRMLGGLRTSASARAHAAELLELGREPGRVVRSA